MYENIYGKIQVSSFVRRRNLPNLLGRIDYISSPKRQEFLEDYYNTEDIDFWKELASQSNKTADYNKNKVDRKEKPYKPIQAVEYMVRLSPEMYDKQTNELKVSAKAIASHFYETFGYKCCVAIHHSKRKDENGNFILDERGNYTRNYNNLHCHLIMCDRELSNKQIKKIAKRDIYYDSSGKRVYKKSLADPSKTIKKGECYSDSRFGTKVEEIRDFKSFNEKMHNWSNCLNNDYSLEHYFFRANDVGYNKTFEAQKKIGNNRPIDSIKYIKKYNSEIRKLNAVKRVALNSVFNNEPTPYYGFRYDNEQLFNAISYKYPKASENLKTSLFRMACYINNDDRVSTQNYKKYDMNKYTVKGFGTWLSQNKQRIDDEIYKYLHSQDENQYDYGRSL